MSIITVERKILEKNDAVAELLRRDFKERNIFVINFLSSPGSGKTSLIEKLATFNTKFRLAVITGDPQTDNDARRINAAGIPVVQIVTNGSCHLDAMLVRDAFKQLNEKSIDLLVIENVGNLVCPAGFDLGENCKVVILSTTEGDDKPLKYPVVFRNSSALIINKTDLAPYLRSSITEIKKNALMVNPHLTIFEVSCLTGNGISAFADWLGNKSEVK